MLELVIINPDSPETGMWVRLTGGSIDGTDVVMYPESYHTMGDLMNVKRLSKRYWDCLRFFTVPYGKVRKELETEIINIISKP